MANHQRSLASSKLLENVRDVFTLLAIRSSVDPKSIDERGRRPPYLEILNRSALVLTCAIWEAYCEDLCEETLENIIEIVGEKHECLPKELRQYVGKKLLDETKPHKVEKIWRFAGIGWKKVLRDNLKSFKEQNIGGFHWAKSRKVEELFKNVLGLPGITQNWKWERSRAETTRKRLDRFVELRGEIAHKGRASKKIQLRDVQNFLTVISRIADKMEETVAEHLKACKPA